MEIPHLTYREIQAPLVSSLIQAFAREIGYTKAIEIAGNVIKQDARVAGKRLAQQYSGNHIPELRRILDEVWAKDNAMEVKIIKESDNELYFDVTCCGYAEMYENMGIKDLGFVLSCSRDFSFIEAFNPKIKLIRTQTIMEGAAYCDFRFEKRRKAWE